MRAAMSGRFRRTLITLSAGLLVAPMLVWAPGAQAASPCPVPGGFEIDGDMLASTCSPAGDDWNSAGLNVTATSQGGTYSTSGKDRGNPSTWTSSGSTPDKTNFAQAYSVARNATVGGELHYLVYVAWERSQATGTQGYAIEIDNTPASVGTGGTPQPNRSSGGYVFFIGATGGGLPTFDSACTFTSQATYAACTNSQAGFTGAYNTKSITDPFTNVSVVAGGFYEVAMDITALTGQAPSCPGSDAATVYLRSITGQVSNGNLKGYMAPMSVQPDSTCVPPAITTTATPGNSTIDGLNVVAPGSAQHDVVTVGTAQAPGVGSVKFYLCQPAEVTANGGDCSANGSLVSTKTLDGSGNATSDSTSNTTASGTYCWRAEFTPGSGDHNYLAASHTNSTTECFTVAHASPTLTTSKGVVTVPDTAVPGSLGLTTLGDTATLSGVLSGADLSGQNVTFKLYGPFQSAPGANSCTSSPVATATGALTKKDATTWTATTSSSYTPTAAGYYTWVAGYAGDQIHDQATHACGQAAETAQISGAQVSVEKDATAKTINAGDEIGFDIKVNNSAGATATGVTVNDPLPALQSNHSWTVDSNTYNCAISGSAPNQTLTCNIGLLNPTQGWVTVAHVHATTGPQDCGTITNSATLTTTNNGGSGSDSDSVTVQCANLAVTKTADAASVNVGSPIGFTITATNNGPGTAYNAQISDPLPGGPNISWSITPAVSGCAISGTAPSQTLTCSANSLASGQSITVHVASSTGWTDSAGVETNSCLGGPNKNGVYNNTATLSASNVTGTKQASASTAVNCPDLHVKKEADAAAVNAGTDIGFTITASNQGTGDATGAMVSDTLPTGTGISWTIDTAHTSGPLTCAIASGALTCTGTLGAGATQTVHITSHTGYASCASYTNTAHLTATNDPHNASDHDTTAVKCANLVITKTPDHSKPVDVGTPIGFTVTVTNTGDGVASGVNVNDTLPTGPGIVWAIDAANTAGPLSCSLSGVDLTCTGSLTAGAEQVVHVTSPTVFKVVGNQTVNSCTGGDGSGVYNNTATESWSNGPAGSISSNQATETVQCPTLSLSKSPDANSVNAGEQIGFTITVTNSGPGTAKNAVINDPLPAGSGVTWAIDNGHTTAAGCAITGTLDQQSLSCTLGDLGVGSQAVHIVSATDPSSCGTYDNAAALSASNAPGLNAEASTAVKCASLVLTKTADAPSVVAGSDIGFTVRVDNAGAGAAKAVTVSDPLPAGPGVHWAMDSGPAGCSVNNDTPQLLECTLDSLAGGESIQVHVSSSTQWTLDPAVDSCLGGDGHGKYDNTASVTASNVPTTGDMTDSASERVLCPNIDVTKTADTAVVDAGSDIGFHITATNTGNTGATGAVLTDPLPGGAGVSWSFTATLNGADAPAGLCSIQDTDGPTLVCGNADFTLGVKDVLEVALTSSTSYATCAPATSESGTVATFDNTVGLTASNTPQQPTAEAIVQVNCADVQITKTALHDGPVDVGLPIGFTVTVTNNGSGTAHGVQVDDPLPTGPGIQWTLDDATGPLDCAIDNGTLGCSGELDPAQTETVTLSSKTSFVQGDNGDVNSCAANEGSGVYDNTASVTWSNGPEQPRTAEAHETVQCPALSLVKTADADSVSSGDRIGFTLDLTNAGPGAASGVTVNDQLPGGTGISWRIDSQELDNESTQLCSLDSNSEGVQTLLCGGSDGFEVAKGDELKVHLVSDTTAGSCGTYDNTATYTAGNVPGGTSSTASVTVQCSTLALTKTADQVVVAPGTAIGFTLTATNNGPGVAHDVVLNDPLPAGDGVDWAISPSYDGAGSCEITGAAGSQTLACQFGDLAAEADASVHITSDTVEASCGDYKNTATLTSANAGTITARAEIGVLCGESVTPTPTTTPPTTPTTPKPSPSHSTEGLASTGAGPLGAELGWAIGLVVLGGLVLALATIRRRRPRSH